MNLGIINKVKDLLRVINEIKNDEMIGDDEKKNKIREILQEEIDIALENNFI